MYHSFARICRIIYGLVSKDTAVTELQFRNRLAEAETDCAYFIDRAYEIAKTLRAEPEQVEGK